MKYILISIVFILSLSVNAHQSSTSFITLESDILASKGLWKVAIEDLTGVQQFDANNDYRIQWRELEGSKNNLFLMLKNNFKIKSHNERCVISVDNSKLALDTILDRNYVLFSFKTNCSITSITDITYNYYFNIDSDHKGVVTLLDDNRKSNIYVAAVNDEHIAINKNTSDSFVNIIKEGVWHIWMGFDHIIFVLTLLFGVLFVHRATTGADKTSGSIEQVNEIIKVISAFTVAHSITLALAALDIVNPSIRFIESSIALTLIIAALHNIRHLFPEKITAIFTWPIWKMAFFFGLVHGFGFANVLAEMNLSVNDLAKTLLAFN